MVLIKKPHLWAIESTEILYSQVAMLTKQSKLPGKQLMPKGGITKPDIIDLQALRTTEAMAACDLQRSSSPTSHLEQDHHQHKIRSCLVTQS